LQNVMEFIRDFVRELAPSVICEYTHHAQSDLLKCHECSPFIENDDVKEEDATFKLIGYDTYQKMSNIYGWKFFSNGKVHVHTST
jgi:hypothetical protein